MDAVEAELVARFDRIEQRQNEAAVRGAELRSTVERLVDAVEKQNGRVGRLETDMGDTHIWQARLESADSAVNLMRRRDAGIFGIVLSIIVVVGPWVRDAILTGGG